MIDNIDQNVGKLTRGLEELGALENTLILFMVDNGPNGRRYVAGMQGMKSHVHEGGYSFSVASALACSPQGGHFLRQGGRPHRRDTYHSGCLWDSFPQRGQKWTAEVFSPFWMGDPVFGLIEPFSFNPIAGMFPFATIFCRSQSALEIAACFWPGKEGFQGAPRLELYDMQLDPLETREVSRFFPEVVKEMTVAYDRWFDDVAATRPNNYAPPKIVIGSMEENPHLAHPPGLALSSGQAVGRQLQWALVGALDAAWLLSRH